MKIFTRKSDNNSYAKYYIQERSPEIDLKRKFPTIVICPGGAFITTFFRRMRQLLCVS